MSISHADDFEWNADKNEQLKRERGICCEDVIDAIQSFGVLADVGNQVVGRSHQRMLIVRLDDYVHVVPYVKGEKGKFLKTIYPSRQYNAIYGGQNE